MAKFKVGDVVQIVNLERAPGMSWSGIKGHVGTVSRVKDSGWCELIPTCTGGSWPPECLDYYRKEPETSKTSISSLFEQKIKQLQNE